MLVITVSGTESFDEVEGVFDVSEDHELELEHSLVSLSKWESIWEKPFLSSEERTREETLSYIECMCLTPKFPRGIFHRLSQENLDAVADYIAAKRTATTIYEIMDAAPSKEKITSELIYYWLVAFNIPFEAENWHLNRLFMLVRICTIKNDGKKKRGPMSSAAQRRDLNAQRKAQLGTTG